MVTVQIAVEAGTKDATEPGTSGAAHALERLLFRGTERFPVPAFEAIYGEAGSSPNAYGTDDLTHFHVTLPAEALPRVLEVEADRLADPPLGRNVVVAEARELTAERAEVMASPRQQMLAALRAAAYGEHPYGRGILGEARDVQLRPERLDELARFADRTYRPERTTVFLVGDLDPEAALSLVEDRFASWKKAPAPGAPDAAAPPKGAAHQHVSVRGAEETWLAFGFRMPAHQAEDLVVPAAEVAATIGFGETSPLRRRLLEEGLVEEVLAWVPMRKGPSVFHLGFRLASPKHAATVQSLVFEGLAELKAAPLDPSRVEPAKSHLRYRLAGHLESPASLAKVAAELSAFARDGFGPDRLMAQYGEVTPELVHEVAHLIFRDENRVTVTLSGGEALPGFDPRKPLEGALPSAFFADPIRSFAAPEVGTGTVAAEVRTKLLPSKAIPLVTLDFVFATGAAYDPPGQKGLAALTAAMIVEGGTRRLTAEQIEQIQFPMAARLEAQVDKEMTRFSATVHQDKLRDFAWLASSQLVEPAFDEQDLRRVKGRLLAAIRDGLVRRNDEELAKEALQAAIFGPEHPYGSPNLGRPDDLEALTVADVRRFFDRHYRPRALILGIAGAYPEPLPGQLLRELRRLPTGPYAVLSLPEPPAVAGREALILEKTTPGVPVSIGFPLDVRRGEEDWPALWLARSWLGEHRSPRGRLFSSLRADRGLTFGAYAYIEPFPEGMFRMQPALNVARRQPLFEMWIRPLRTNQDAHFAARAAVFELESLVEHGLDEAEFDRTRTFLDRSVALTVVGQQRALAAAIDADFYGTEDFVTYVRRGLRALTVEATNRAIRRHLDPKNARFVFVTRDAKNMAQRLEKDVSSPVSYPYKKPALTEVDLELIEKPLKIQKVRFAPADSAF